MNLGSSYLENCEFTKTKDTTFLNLKFDESFPLKFWRSGKLTKVKDFSRFAKLLKALDEELDSTDER